MGVRVQNAAAKAAGGCLVGDPAEPGARHLALTLRSLRKTRELRYKRLNRA